MRAVVNCDITYNAINSEGKFWSQRSETEFNQIQEVLSSFAVHSQIKVIREMKNELIRLHTLDDAVQISN
jgi:hypothetical protein